MDRIGGRHGLASQAVTSQADNVPIGEAAAHYSMSNNSGASSAWITSYRNAAPMCPSITR